MPRRKRAEGPLMSREEEAILRWARACICHAGVAAIPADDAAPRARAARYLFIWLARFYSTADDEQA